MTFLIAFNIWDSFLLFSNLNIGICPDFCRLAQLFKLLNQMLQKTICIIPLTKFRTGTSFLMPKAWSTMPVMLKLFTFVKILSTWLWIWAGLGVETLAFCVVVVAIVVVDKGVGVVLGSVELKISIVIQCKNRYIVK